METESKLLTIPKAAALLGLSERVAQLDVQKNGTLAGLPIITVHGRRYVSSQQIDRLLAGSAA